MAAIQAIDGHLINIIPLISEIVSLIHCLASSGTKVKLFWISNHVGIEGNTIVA